MSSSADSCPLFLTGTKDIDEEKTGKPAFLMVVTKNKVAKQLENGVYVVPLCCLKN